MNCICIFIVLVTAGLVTPEELAGRLRGTEAPSFPGPRPLPAHSNVKIY